MSKVSSLDPFSRSYRFLIEAFGFSRVLCLSKKVSSYCLSCLEYILEHEFKVEEHCEISLQEFADELFTRWDNVPESDTN